MKHLTFYSLVGLLVIFTFSCSKDKTETKDQENLTGDYDEYFVAKVDGENFVNGFKYVTSGNGSYSGLVSNSGTSCEHTLGKGFYPYSDESLSSSNLDFVDFHQGYCGGFEENTRFYKFFSTGEYDFSDGQSKGVVITLAFDSKNGPYYTTAGIEQPSDSYIRITESEEYNIELIPGHMNFGQLLTGEFNVRMFDPENPSDIIDVNNGMFKLRVESWKEGTNY